MPVLSERFMKSWAVTALLMVIVIALLPSSALQSIFTDDPFASRIQRILSAALAVSILIVVLGCQLKMLFECGINKRVAHRSWWLIALIFIPLVPAFLFFWFGRPKSGSN
jgi:cytochrome bd-type quinol oxidase subunit 2